MSADQEKHQSFDDTSAADEPTAMWDAGALKDLGLEEAAKAHEDVAAKAPLNAPVTQPLAPARPRAVPKKRGKSAAEGLSWPVVALIAVALGLVVYFGVSLLLG